MNYNKININKINYSEPYFDNGIYYSKAILNNKPIIFETPKLKIREDLMETKNRTYLDLELDKYDYEFYNFLCELDEGILIKAFQNSEDWFNKEVPIEVLDDYHRQTIKNSSKNNNPYFRGKIPLYKNNDTTIALDNIMSFGSITNAITISF